MASPETPEDPFAEQELSIREAQYSVDAHNFRQDVFKKVGRAATGEKARWAYFQFTPDSHAPLRTDPGGAERQVLVLTYEPIPVDQEPGQTVATDGPWGIRVIANEGFIHNKEVAWLSEDFVLDGENDAQYCVDALMSRRSTTGVVALYTPLLLKVGGELMFSENTPQYPMAITWGKEAGTEEEIVPFGVYTEFSHRRDALDAIREVFAEVKDLEPEMTGTVTPRIYTGDREQ